MEVAYNPYQRGFYDNPRPVYRQLRDKAPLYWSEACNFWVLSRYDDVRAALLNWKVFSNEAGSGSTGPAGELFEQAPNLLMFDPPRHTHMRKIVAQLITPQLMRAMRDQVRAQDRLDGFQLAGFPGHAGTLQPPRCELAKAWT